MPRKFTDAQGQQLRRDYERGKTFAQIAAQHGTGAEVVRKYVLRAGGRSRAHSEITYKRNKERSPLNGVLDADVLAAYEENGPKWAADKFGCSVPTVRSAVIRAGGTIRTDCRNWNAKGWHINPQGYVVEVVPANWPFLKEMGRMLGGYTRIVLQHRKIMAESLGRALLPTETVHHINGDKTDNSIENLQLHHRKHGNGVRFRCACCGSDKLEPIPL